ncbi:4-hydroxybutyrate CoA-transferase, partial [Tyzzerella sp. OttesenSCG-928-J15]|nr:4-hydroxybutyrate CoA-transferase [Tyzzerella sp. OttesenSCG-928-J15]
MKNWKEHYNSHKISIDEAIRKIPSESYVVTSHCASEPKAILKAMAENKERYKNVNIFNLISMGEAPYCAPEMEGHFTYNTIFVSTGSRKAFDKGRGNFVYSYYSELPALIGSAIPVDVAILHVSPPDNHGYMSFGLTVDYQKKAADSAKIVIAQVNSKMPRTLGNAMIHVSEIDWFCEVSENLPELPLPVDTA